MAVERERGKERERERGRGREPGDAKKMISFCFHFIHHSVFRFAVFFLLLRALLFFPVARGGGGGGERVQKKGKETDQNLYLQKK